MALAIFTFPNRVVFGEGAIRELPGECERLGIRRPLLVTDGGVARLGFFEQLRASWASVPVFAGVHANPTSADVEAGLDRYRTKECDGIVAVGGGSPIDAAKGIRLLATHPGELADYDVTTEGAQRITANLPPMVAVPTTAGTGSEVGRAALIQDARSGRKAAVISPYLLPSVGICDPELTYGLSAELTAGTGMDALSHAVESYCSTTFHPICDGIALEALRHIARGLESCVQDGGDAIARRSMMLGSLLAGISFHKGLGVVHAVAHALGGEGRVHHGTLCGILLPHAIRFNREVAEPRLRDLAAALGLGRSGDGPGHLLAAIDLLIMRFPMPKRLRDVEGLDRARFDHYARLAARDHTLATNPRSATVPELKGLIEAAW